MAERSKDSIVDEIVASLQTEAPGKRGVDFCQYWEQAKIIIRLLCKAAKIPDWICDILIAAGDKFCAQGAGGGR